MCVYPPVDSEEKTGASANAIEITPEIIEAGADIIERELYHDPLISRGLALSLSEAILSLRGVKTSRE
jgi:hypothetical protein